MFFSFDNSAPAITHVDVRITSEPPKPSNANKPLLLRLDCFALNPTLIKEGDLVLEIEQNVSGQPQVQKSHVERFSATEHAYDGKQISFFVRVLCNTVYRMVIKRKEDLRRDESTPPMMTLSLRYDPSTLLSLPLLSSSPLCVSCIKFSLFDFWTSYKLNVVQLQNNYPYNILGWTIRIGQLEDRPKGTISDRQCRFSTKFSKPFDHHGKTKGENLKKSLENEKSELPPRPASNFDRKVFGYALEDACVKVANVKSRKCNMWSCFLEIHLFKSMTLRYS